MEQNYHPASAANTDSAIRPSWIFYLLGAFGILASIIGLGVFIFTHIASMNDMFSHRMLVPTVADVNFSQIGTYTVFHEYRSDFEGRIIRASESSLSNVQFSLKERSSGKQIDIQPSSINSSYTIGNRAGSSVAKFEIQQAGDYVFLASFPQGSEPIETVVGFSNNFASSLIQTILIGAGIFFGGLALSALIIGITYFKRNACKKRMSHSYNA